MGKALNSNEFNLPPDSNLPSTEILLPNVILGDEAFALSKFMMKPFPRNQSMTDKSKAIFNYRLSRARRTTENAFGILSNVFRIFHTPINAKVSKIDKIIVASTILHNLMRDENISTQPIIEMPSESNENIILPTENLTPISVSMGRPNADGTSIRNQFKDYFNGVGSVQWQNNMI